MLRKKISALVAVAAFMAAVAVPSAAHAALSADLSQVINPGTLAVDVVDGSNVSIASPALSFGAVNFSFSCQPATATLGTASQKIRVDNPKYAGVKIDLNAQTPATDKWSDGGSASYKYNDATGSGCTNGQLAVSGGTLTKVDGATVPTYTTPGGAFSGAASVTLLNNTSATPYTANLTNYTLTQQIPAEQIDGTYSLPMVVSYVAQ